jgi:hypothetical protein
MLIAIFWKRFGESVKGAKSGTAGWDSPTFAAEVLKRAKEIQSLVDRVPLAPPELAADILIRIAASGRVTDRIWKMEMLEDAFLLPAHAAFPLRIVGGLPIGICPP